MNTLLKYRDEIDRIDTQLVELFEERMKVSEAVARYKIETGMQVLDADRELQKIRSVMEKASTPFNKTGMKELITQIMAISRKRQYQLLTEQGIEDEDGFEVVPALSLSGSRVVFQGVEGAYSHAAMQAYFGSDITSYHVKTWHDAMEEVKEGRADYAVLPIENSTAGIVADIYDLLMEYDLVIAAEQVIRVEHVLLGLPGATLRDIRTVVSHPQGLAQCRDFLQAHPLTLGREGRCSPPYFFMFGRTLVPGTDLCHFSSVFILVRIGRRRYLYTARSSHLGIRR